MKLLPLLLAFASAGLVFAQETSGPAAPVPAPPQAQAPLPELAPLPDPSTDGDLLRNQPGGRLRPAPEPSLIPGIPGRAGGDRPKGRSTLRPPTTSADLEARIRYRQAHSRAANEAPIQALWEESREAKTDYAKRDALRRYYTLLYRRILTFDKTIAPLVQERQRISLRRLDQTRIEPTDPLEEEYRQRRE